MFEQVFKNILVPQEPDFSTGWRSRFAEIQLETKGSGWLPRYYQENVKFSGVKIQYH